MKILIELMHGLGDVVCALPMIENVRLAYSNADITVLVNSQGAKEIIECGRSKVDKIIILNVHSQPRREVLWQIMNLRRNKYDIGISCAITSVKKAHMFMGAVAPKKKIGIQFSEKKDFMMLPKDTHFVDANLSAIEMLGLAVLVNEPVLVPDNAIIKQIKSIINNKDAPIVGVCIGNADITFRYRLIRKKPVYTRGWGINNMSALCQKIIGAGHRLILIGGTSELPLLAELSDEVVQNAISFVGKTTVKESIALASLCDVVVGVDTGMQHIADAVGSNTVSIFGPTSAKGHGAHSKRAKFVEYLGECRDCFGTPNYTKCNDRKCLKEITVNQVYAVVNHKLQEDYS